eukprot:12679013-Alexandrium_andersonii.AAC.1
MPLLWAPVAFKTGPVSLPAPFAPALRGPSSPAGCRLRERCLLGRCGLQYLGHVFSQFRPPEGRAGAPCAAGRGRWCLCAGRRRLLTVACVRGPLWAGRLPSR